MGDDKGGRGHPILVEFEGSVVVSCAPREAFAIADMATLAEWNPAVARSELVAGESLVEGAEYECTMARGPMKLAVHPVLVEVRPDCFVRYAGEFGFAHSEDSITFAPDGNGTRLTFRNTSTLPRWTRPLRWVITRAFHRQANRSVRGAARYLESRDEVG